MQNKDEKKASGFYIFKITLVASVGGPFNYRYPAAAPAAYYWKKAGIPYARLHDCNWPHVDVVDIHTIFPLFYLDADDPKNYYFKKTDDYIAAIIKNETEVIYRVGESIEYNTQYFIHPPKDYEKWAKICINIIRHYNDGWANGFHYNIKYWEIWNEPNGKGEWSGTYEQYFKLYEVTSKAIKKYNPLLRVGGPSARAANKEPFVTEFLKYCSGNSLPLDFYSWHMYETDPVGIVNRTENVRRRLNEYGYKDTESYLNEWHFNNLSWSGLALGDTGNKNIDLTKYAKMREGFAEINGPKGAAFAASVLILLQDAPVDKATYYTGDYSRGWGLFNAYGIPRKPYYTFKVFNQLAEIENMVACTYNDPSTDSAVVFLAAISGDKKTAAILISNPSTVQELLDVSLKNFSGSKEIRADVYCVDKPHNLDLTERREINTGFSVLTLDLSPYSVYLIKLTR